MDLLSFFDFGKERFLRHIFSNWGDAQKFFEYLIHVLFLVFCNLPVNVTSLMNEQLTLAIFALLSNCWPVSLILANFLADTWLAWSYIHSLLDWSTYLISVRLLPLALLLWSNKYLIPIMFTLAIDRQESLLKGHYHIQPKRSSLMYCLLRCLISLLLHHNLAVITSFMRSVASKFHHWWI